MAMSTDASKRSRLFSVCVREATRAISPAGACATCCLTKSRRTTTSRPARSPRISSKFFPTRFPVGAQFGVILVVVDGTPFEVASFRHDGPYLDGRHPSHVRYGSLREDVLRRDFTINGMVYDPVDDRVIDLVERPARSRGAASSAPSASRARASKKTACA